MKKNASPLSRIISFLPGGVVLILAFALIALFAYPKLQSFEPQQEKVRALEKDVSLLNQKLKNLSAIDTASVDELSIKTEIALPQDKTFAGLLTGMDALSKEAGSSLVTFGSSPGLISTGAGQLKDPSTLETNASDSAGLKYLEAVVGLNSNASSLVSLVSKLASSGRLVTLQTINYSNSTNGATNANTSILVRVYYQPQDGSVALEKLSVIPLSEEEKQLIAKVDSLNRFSLSVPASLPSNLDPFGIPQTLAPPQATSSPVPQI